MLSGFRPFFFCLLINNLVLDTFNNYPPHWRSLHLTFHFTFWKRIYTSENSYEYFLVALYSDLSRLSNKHKDAKFLIYKQTLLFHCLSTIHKLSLNFNVFCHTSNTSLLIFLCLSLIYCFLNESFCFAQLTSTSVVRDLRGYHVNCYMNVSIISDILILTILLLTKFIILLSNFFLPAKLLKYTEKFLKFGKIF